MAESVSCGLCHRASKEPVSLECGHHLCLPCDRIKNPGNGQTVICPQCRVATLPTIKRSKSPDHTYVNYEKPAYSTMFDSATVVNLPLGACQLCVMTLEPRKASRCCKDCQRAICEQCKESHSLNPKFKGHTFSAKDETTIKMLICSRHSREEIKYFCKKCTKAACDQCLKEHESHDTHIVPWPEQMQNLQTKLKDKERQMKENVTDLKTKVLKTKEVSKTVKEEFQNARKVVQHRTASVTDQIKRWQERHDKEIGIIESQQSEIWQGRIEKLNQLAAQTERTANLLESTIGETDYENLIKNCKQIEDNSKTLTDQSALLTPITAPAIELIGESPTGKLEQLLGGIQVKEYYPDFEKIAVDMAKTQTPDKLPSTSAGQHPNWEATTTKSSSQTKGQSQSLTEKRKLLWTAEMGSNPGQVHFPISIAISDTKQVFVSEAGSHRVQCFDGRGVSLWTTATSTKLEPRGLAIGNYNNLYVANVHQASRGISVMDTSGKILGSWGQGDLTYPKDIAINSKGNIIVADKTLRRIFEFSVDGKRMRSFGSKGNGDVQFQEPNFITTDPHDRIIVSDTVSLEIKIFSNSGALQKKFVPMIKGKKQVFNGICTDSESNILVALHDSHQIAKFSPSGEYMETVLGNHTGVWWPVKQALGPEGEMVVAETQSDQKHSAVKLFNMVQ